MNKLFLLPLFCILIFPLVSAQSGHMTLLAVSETENGHVGGTADLDLEIKPGSGRVFLETFPFTQVDTQMSTRFANEIACDYVDVDCDQYDFFYTISSGSSIVAGPSAGAAMTALTIGLLNGDRINSNVAITGTINSGGIIGPVGGVLEKVEAAAHADLDTVLIPPGFSALENTTRNETPFDVGTRTGITVVQVATLDQTLHYFLGYDIPKRKQVDTNPHYAATMKMLGEQLCNRSTHLQTLVENSSALTRAKNLSNLATTAQNQNQHYAAASYCYGANVEYVAQVLREQNMSVQTKREYVEKLQNQITRFKHKAENFSIQTITDLETYMIVKERLDEAQEHVDRERNSTNVTDRSPVNLAWATERLHSAESWSQFLDHSGKQVTINSHVLAGSCLTKIAEVEQRIKYIEQFAFLPISHVKEGVEQAQEHYDKGNNELCLFKAAKAKGEIGVVLSVLGVSAQHYQELLDIKLSIVSDQLAKSAEDNAFPILGYSYYEYSQSLRNNDPISALLYAEYALELGALDMYFAQADKKSWSLHIDWNKFNIFLIGLVLGIIITLIVKRPIKKKHRKKKTKK